jgi:hypothetical protein
MAVYVNSENRSGIGRAELIVSGRPKAVERWHNIHKSE